MSVIVDTARNVDVLTCFVELQMDLRLPQGGHGQYLIFVEQEDEMEIYLWSFLSQKYLLLQLHPLSFLGCNHDKNDNITIFCEKYWTLENHVSINGLSWSPDKRCMRVVCWGVFLPSSTPPPNHIKFSA
jgi:hypothetical protein